MTDQHDPNAPSPDEPVADAEAREAEARAEVAHAAADHATAQHPGDDPEPGVPDTGDGSDVGGQDGGNVEDGEAGDDGEAGEDVGAPGEAPAEVPDDPRSREELLEALRRTEQQRDEYLKDVQRLQAEFDNFRKRTMREGAGQRAAGVAELTGKLLDVLDDFDMALMSVNKIRPAPDSGDTNDTEALHKGLELVYSKLIAVLKGAGLQRIDHEDVPFDPERHEAVQQVDAEDGPLDQPLVVDVLRPGYEMQGRVIRAAMVKVAQ